MRMRMTGKWLVIGIEMMLCSSYGDVQDAPEMVARMTGRWEVNGMEESQILSI